MTDVKSSTSLRKYHDVSIDENDAVVYTSCLRPQKLLFYPNL